MEKPFDTDNSTSPYAETAEPCASQALVDFAAEHWKLTRTVERCVPGMDPMDADRFLNHFEWYQRKTWAVLEEAGLILVDLTGQEYHPGMAATPLNLEDFPDWPGARFRVGQMVEPIVMERGRIRKAGTVMLCEEADEG